MKNGLGIFLAGVVALALGAYGGFVAANVQGMATAEETQADPGPAVVDCTAGERALQDRLEALTAERSSLEAKLDRRYVEAQAGPSSHPPGLLPVASIGSLVRVTLGADVVLLHCREYPCVAVVRGEPSAEAIAGLATGGFTPRVVGQGDHRAIVLAHEALPTPDRTTPRVAALLRLVGG